MLVGTGPSDIYYEVVLILLAIYHLGRFALRHHTEKAADLAHHLPGMETPAQVITDDGIQTRPAAEVMAGQRVRIGPDGLVPVDGIIVSGLAFIEELAHTGEPFPAARQAGDRVLAGSRVLDGTIDISATSSGRDRELDRLLAACRDTIASPAENLAQRVLAGFVPTVIVVALGTAAFWSLVQHNPAAALFNALAVTIVACPCALGLAIPIAARKALMRLRLLGLVAQQPDIIERLAAIDAVAFDKTGTLSHPRLGLEALEVVANAPPELAGWLAAIQRRSTHPVARPFWNLSQPAQLADLSIEVMPAHGIEARFTHNRIAHRLRIGNELLLVDSTQPVVSTTRCLYILIESKLVVVVRLTESPRETALDTLDKLRDLGLRRILLTGDTSCPPIYREALDHHGRQGQATERLPRRGPPRSFRRRRSQRQRRTSRRPSRHRPPIQQWCRTGHGPRHAFPRQFISPPACYHHRPSDPPKACAPAHLQPRLQRHRHEPRRHRLASSRSRRAVDVGLVSDGAHRGQPLD